MLSLWAWILSAYAKKADPCFSLFNFSFQVQLILDIKYISNTEEMCTIFLGGLHLREYAVLGLNMPEAGPNPPVLWNMVTSPTSVELCFVLLSILPYHLFNIVEGYKSYSKLLIQGNVSHHTPKQIKTRHHFFQIFSSSKDVWKIISFFFFFLCSVLL